MGVGDGYRRSNAIIYNYASIRFIALQGNKSSKKETLALRSSEIRKRPSLTASF